jgi:hypothetical protein
MPDCLAARQRKAFWPHGMTRIEKARVGPAYITKYASKGDILGDNGEPRPMPRGARIFGVGGPPEARRHAYWRALPAYVRAETTPDDVIRRADKGGGFVVLTTGVWIPSQWTMEWQAIAGGRWLLRLKRKEDPVP